MEWPWTGTVVALVQQSESPKEVIAHLVSKVQNSHSAVGLGELPTGTPVLAFTGRWVKATFLRWHTAPASATPGSPGERAHADVVGSLAEDSRHCDGAADVLIFGHKKRTARCRRHVVSAHAHVHVVHAHAHPCGAPRSHTWLP